MVISFTAYVEHPDLALTHTIRELPDVDIGVVDDAGTDPNHDVYFFWVEADDYAAVEAAFEADPTVASYRTIIEGDDRHTYGLEYADDVTLLSPVVTEVGGLVHESRSHGNGWLLTIHLQDHDTLHELNEYLSDEGYLVDVFELQHVETTRDRSEFGLTPSQIEALVCAYVHGYYDQPRQISQAELGSILGVSETAVSGRLRRGSARLAEAVLEE